MGFGSDFSGVDDIDANWTFLDGEANENLALAQASARRLSTPRGGNPFDPSYGYDVRDLVGSSADPSTAEREIAAELVKDERVDDCKSSIVVSGPVSGQTWTISVNGFSTSGASFAFTLSVDAVTVSLLTVGQ